MFRPFLSHPLVTLAASLWSQLCWQKMGDRQGYWKKIIKHQK
jgi:hypothetical protein